MLDRGRWVIAFGRMASPTDTAQTRKALTQGAVEIRVVPRRQVFVGGRPVGDVLDEATPAVEASRPLR